MFNYLLKSAIKATTIGNNKPLFSVFQTKKYIDDIVDSVITKVEKENKDCHNGLPKVKITFKVDKEEKKWSKLPRKIKLIHRNNTINCRIISQAAEKLAFMNKCAEIEATSLINSIDYDCKLIFSNDFYFCKYNNLYYMVGSKYEIFLSKSQLEKMLDNDNPEEREKKTAEEYAIKMIRHIQFSRNHYTYRYDALNADINVYTSYIGRHYYVVVHLTNRKHNFFSTTNFSLKECQKIFDGNRQDIISFDIFNKIKNGYLREAGVFFLNGCKFIGHDDDGDEFKLITVNRILSNK